MCRIAAIIGYNNKNLEHTARLMANAMAHGGPDDEGVFLNTELSYCLAHRRLSIIDLSSMGHQPMLNDTGTIQIIFNGEVYNYAELKAILINKGFKFRSGSDTEVLIHGYSYWGIDELLKRVKGMFSFIIADTVKKILVAARDQHGIKPLYYSQYGGYFYFSSEVRSFKAINENWPKNPNWNIWFLTFGFIPEPNTTLDQVFSLERGHYMQYNLNSHDYIITCYYKHNYEPIDVSYEEAVDNVRNLFEQSIKRHLVADVPVGIFLSGGLDSSLITYAVKNYTETPTNSLSIYFEDKKYSEQLYQDIVSKDANTIHKSYKIDFEEFSNSWSDIERSLDQPSIDAINSYFICKYAKLNNLKVVMSGLGGDEFFGGYNSFNRSNYYKQLRKFSYLIYIIPFTNTYPRKKIEFLTDNNPASEYLFYRGLYTPKDVAGILGIDTKDVWDELSKFKTNDHSALLEPKNRVSMLESTVYMQSQLLKDSDVQSMWHSIELRVPFLDIDLTNYVNSLPPEIKYKEGRHKPLLIDAFKDIIPREIWDRPKKGFTFPFDVWFKKVDVFNNQQVIPSKFAKEFKKGQINFSRVWSIYLNNTFGLNFDYISESTSVKPKILFAYLIAFSKTGGIEKVNRTILRCLTQENKLIANAWSIYDKNPEINYYPRFGFKGFNSNKLLFTTQLIKNIFKWDKILVGHINLSAVMRAAKKMKPSLKIVLIAHGIEVWGKLSANKLWLLKNADSIISVSEYTKNRMVKDSAINPDNITVLHNCLDPFFPKNFDIERPRYLSQRYNIDPHTKIVLTVSRINKDEGYKGYDTVIKVLGRIIIKDPSVNFKYILCGKYDSIEYKRIMDLIVLRNLSDKVILPGFILDSELVDHYRLSDIYIMPSKKEGFGIVYIEAAACGLEVIAGNADGSAEAMMNGEIGHLVNPDDEKEIYEKLYELLNKPLTKSKEISDKAYLQYDFDKYKERFLDIIEEV